MFFRQCPVSKVCTVGSLLRSPLKDKKDVSIFPTFFLLPANFNPFTAVAVMILHVAVSTLLVTAQYFPLLRNVECNH